MNGITELAKLLKDRENGSDYSPMFGTVIELPNVKIRISEKIILTESYLVSCVNLHETDIHGRYVHLNSRVVLLPYSGNQKFIVMGVVL